MLDRTETQVAPGPGEGAAIVSALSVFLQAEFLQVEDRPLAMRAAADLAERLGVWSGNRDPIEIRIGDEELRVNGRPVAGAEDQEAWLALAFGRRGLAGLRLHPGTTADGLLDLARSLRSTPQPDAPTLFETWKNDTIELLPASTPRSPVSEAARLMQGLARSATARSALGQLHAAVDLGSAGRSRLDSAQLLEAILARLPDALRRNDRTACEIVERILDQMIAQLDGFLVTQSTDPSHGVADLAAVVTRSVVADGLPSPDELIAAAESVNAAREEFALGGFGLPPVDVTIGVAATGDKDATDSDAPSDAAGLIEQLGRSAEPLSSCSGQADPLLSMDPRRVADDPEKLREELGCLPATREFRLDSEPARLTDELLGTCMHLLVCGRDPERVEQLITPLVDRVLADPTPGQRRTLGRYLRLARERGGANGDAIAARLIAFLKRHGVEQLMTARETIDVEQVIRTFPAQFVIWLDALEIRDEDSHRQFTRLCESVGAPAIAEIARVMIDDGTLLTPNRTEKILKFGGEHVAAVARMLVESEASWTRAQVVNYLRRRELPRGEAAALAVIQPIAQLPTPYLSDLCRCVEHGEVTAKVHAYSSLLLRHCVRDTANRPGDLDRRLYAIRALSSHECAENRQYLEELTRSGRLVNRTKEARAVRQAASETLRAMNEEKRGRG